MEINQTFEILDLGRFLSVFLIFCDQMSPPPLSTLGHKNWEMISSTSENS